MAIAKTRELCEADGASLLLIEHVDRRAVLRHGRRATWRGHRTGAAARAATASRAGWPSKARPRLVDDVPTAPTSIAPSIARAGYHHRVDRRRAAGAGRRRAGRADGGALASTRRRSRPLHLERLVALAPHVAIAVHNAQITTALRTSQSAGARRPTSPREEGARAHRADQPRQAGVGAHLRRHRRAHRAARRLRHSPHQPAYARRVGLRVQRSARGRPATAVFAGREHAVPRVPAGEGPRRGRWAPSSRLTSPRGRPRRHLPLLRLLAVSDDANSNAVVIHYHDITQSHVLEERCARASAWPRWGSWPAAPRTRSTTRWASSPRTCAACGACSTSCAQPLRAFADVV